jgi:hypothetical protein
MSDGVYDCLTMKKNEISGQKFAFVKSGYVHEYTDGDVELEDSIEKRHEKFIRVGRRLKKHDNVPGNKTPFWVAKIQSSQINGISEDNVIEFSFLKDSKEVKEKYDLLDIALKKLHNSAVTDAKDKKSMKKMSDEQVEELTKEMPQFMLKNPVGPFKSAYAEVFENYLKLLENYENQKEDNSVLSGMLPNRSDKFNLLESILKESNVFQGGYLPPMLSNERSPFGIYTDSFLEYWQNLSKEPAYSYFTEMHG